MGEWFVLHSLLYLLVGAIYTTGGSLGIHGHVTFADNSAVEFGGAIFSLEDDPVTLQGQLSFVRNCAGPGGGAVSIGDPGEISVVGAKFSRNKANVGGAISVNAARNIDREFKECIFEYNTAAADGGAMHFFSTGGSDIVNSSLFRGNYAENAGGAIYNKETLKLFNTMFWGNTAHEKSFALQGSAAVILNNVSFVNNTIHCAFGDYSYEDTLGEEEASDDTRFKLDCAECSTAGNRSNHYRVQVEHRNRIPTCEAVPTGVEALSSGTTVEYLTLKAGYFRITDKSRDILECHRQRSCLGGNDTNDYCATGYVGPYCAACAEGFAPWTAFECRQCSDADRPSAVGLLVTIAIILVAVGAALSSFLMRANHRGDGQDETEISPGSLERRWIYRANVFVKVFPLTAVKIVVVVWQIISQFATVAGDVYPEEYSTFISNLSFINLDIGAILSYSCLVSTDFYHHLLVNTIAPLVVLMALCGTYYVAQKRNQGSEDVMREVQHKHLSAGLFVSFLVYSSVSFTIFQTFGCETLDDGVSYLRADYSLTCDTDRYAIYRAYAIVMLCVYPIGLPAILSWWLIRNRVDLKKDNRTTMKHLEPFSGIWSQYKPSRYYYEVVEFGRRIALTATASFVPPNSVAQIAVVLLVAAVLVFVVESMSPFSSTIDMSLYRWGNGIILASMYVALLLKIDASDEESSELSAFGVVLIAANVFMAVTVLVQSMLMTFELKGVTWSAG